MELSKGIDTLFALSVFFSRVKCRRRHFAREKDRRVRTASKSCLFVLFC